MRKIKTVKIDLDSGKSKEFTIKELSVKDIIELSQTNSFFKKVEEPLADTPKKSQNGEEPANTALPLQEKSFLEELKDYSDEIGKVMEKICDFTINDLVELSPSEIKILFNSFREVNHDFLDVLEKLKIIELFQKLVTRHMSGFSKMLAIL